MKKMFLLFVCSLMFFGCSTTKYVEFRTLHVTENPVGAKIGQVDRTKGGILEAARNGNITKISTVSVQQTNTYTTHYWLMCLLVAPVPILTESLHEIIVTGE